MPRHRLIHSHLNKHNYELIKVNGIKYQTIIRSLS